MELIKAFPKMNEVRGTQVIEQDSKIIRIAKELIAKGIDIPQKTLSDGIREEVRQRYREFVQQQTTFAKQIRDEIVKKLESGELSPIPNVAAKNQVTRQFIQRLTKWTRTKVEFERNQFGKYKEYYNKLEVLVKALEPYKGSKVMPGKGVDLELLKKLVKFSQLVEAGLMKEFDSSSPTKGNSYIETVYSDLAKNKREKAYALLARDPVKNKRFVDLMEEEKRLLNRAKGMYTNSAPTSLVESTKGKSAEPTIEILMARVAKIREQRRQMIEDGYLPSVENVKEAMKLLEESKLGTYQNPVSDRGSVPLPVGQYKGVAVRRVPISRLLHIAYSEPNPKYEQHGNAMKGIVVEYLLTSEGRNREEEEVRRRSRLDFEAGGGQEEAQDPALARQTTPRTGRKGAEEIDAEFSGHQDRLEKIALVQFIQDVGIKFLEFVPADEYNVNNQATKMALLVRKYLDPKKSKVDRSERGRYSQEVIDRRRKEYYKLRARVLPDWSPASDIFFKGKSVGLDIVFNKIMDMIEKLTPGSPIEDIHEIIYEIERSLQIRRIKEAGLTQEDFDETLSSKLKGYAYDELDRRISTLGLLAQGEIIDYNPANKPAQRDEDLLERKKAINEYLENLNAATSTGVESDVEPRFEVGGGEGWASAGYEIPVINPPIDPGVPDVDTAQLFSALSEVEEERHAVGPNQVGAFDLKYPPRYLQANEEDPDVIRIHQNLRKWAAEF